MERGAFSTKDSKTISDAYVAVRVTGGDDMDAGAWEFMSTYDVQSFPTLLVMNARGHVVNRNVRGDVNGMLDALLRADLAEEEFARSAESKDATVRLERAKLLETRMAWDDAVAAYRSLAQDAPSEKVRTALRRLAHKRANIHIQNAQVDWVLDPPVPGEDEKREELLDKYETRLVALGTKFGEQKDVDGIAAVLVMRGRVASMRKRTKQAQGHFDAVLAEHGKTLAAAPALLGKAELAHEAEDFAACKQLLARLLREHPEADEVRAAQNMLRHVEQDLERGGHDGK